MVERIRLSPSPDIGSQHEISLEPTDKVLPFCDGLGQ